jgi:hypothetical protein
MFSKEWNTEETMVEDGKSFPALSAGAYTST